MRLVIILLLLVVLPTALLSVLAGRSIQAREVILQRRLEQDAIRLIDGVNDQFNAWLKKDATEIADAFRQTILAGMNADRMTQSEVALRQRCFFVKRAYLFMNPWGFVFPGVVDPMAEDPLSLDALLRQDLIGTLSTEGRAKAPFISIARDGRKYRFMMLPDFAGLYAGFEIDVDAALGRLESMVAAASTEDMVLRLTAGGSGADAGRPVGGDDVLILDSLTQAASRPRRPGAEGGGTEGALASGALPAPFADVSVLAFLARADEIQHAEALEARLIAWGILLLAIVITVSSTIVIRRMVHQATIARRRSEFVIGMSHDLRTPIASMRILADSLCAGRVQDPEKQRRFLRTIASECERLGDMIERILFFFRQEQGVMTYAMEPFDIGERVAMTVRAFRDRQHSGASVALELPEAPVMVDGDASALAKVITNLLDNAVKYGVQQKSAGAEGAVPDVGGASEGAAERRVCDIMVRVHTAAHRRRNWAVISVSDHGPGIPEQEHEKIFSRFYRRDTELHRHVGGIGLGLFLCADIVRAHRGRITVDSRVGAGAEFSVWLRSKSKSGNPKSEIGKQKSGERQDIRDASI